MNRRLLALFGGLVVAAVAAPAYAGTTGFALTHEENLAFPPAGQWIAVPGYDAAVGKVQIFSSETAYLTDQDPVQGPAPCDPTTAKALILDSSSRVAEAHLKFPMTAAGNLIVFDKMELGAERTNVRGLRAGVFSGATRTPEISFEFGADGFVYVFGQRVVTATGDLRYENLWANNCALGIDNHITLIMWHNLPAGTVMIDLKTHGNSGQAMRLGPFPMAPAVKAEGIGGMYLNAPPLGGRYYVDGMVCNGNSPVVLPTGNQEQAGERTRF